MMLTRCPACQTVFRLHPAQIRARNGEVRCGHCFNPFNALQHRIATADEVAAATGRQQASFPTAGEPTPVAAAQSPARRNEVDELDFELPEFPPFDDGRAAPGAARQAEPAHGSPAGTAGVGSDTELVAPHEHPVAESGAGSSLPEVIRSARRSPSPPEPPSAAAGGTAPALDDHPVAAAAPGTPEPELESEAEQWQEHEPAGDAAARQDSGPATTPQARHVDLNHLDATYGRPPSKRSAVARTLGGMVVGLLAGTLAAQATYLFRTEIGRALPGTRPLLEAGCAALGCEVPLPKDVALIGIETSDLQSDPARAGRYTLFTTVRNRADYPQAWPHLELTLTDGSDTPVVRRVFAPTDWMPADSPKASLPARATIPVRLPFRLEGASPTGYRVYVFYP